VARLALVLAASLLGLGFAPFPAVAGTYDVVSCGAAPGSVNRAWEFRTNSQELEGSGPTPCVFPAIDSDRFLGEPDSGAFGGLWARTIIPSGTPLPASGHYAEWRIEAPSGTAITGMHVRRWLGLEAGSGWFLYGRSGDSTLLPGETCTVIAGADECNVGGPGTDWAEFADLSTASIAYGFRCGRSDCTDGATIHHARAAVYAARVTISDPIPPALGTPTGSLLDPGDRSGTETLTVAGRDEQGGLRELRAYVDDEDEPRATAAFACDPTLTQPCPTAWTTGALPLDTRQLEDGPHRLVLAAIDAGGNERRGTAQSFRTENHAPAAPRGLTVDGTAPEVVLRWEDPPDRGAPIVAAHYELCPPSGDCVRGRAPLPGPRALVLRVPGHAVWTVRLWLEDAAGHANAAGAARAAIDQRLPEPASDAPPPSATPAPPTAPSVAAPAPTVLVPARTPAPRPASTAPSTRAASRLLVTSLTRTRTALRVRGRVSPRAATVVATLRARLGRRATKTTVRTRARAGRFALTFRAPAGARGRLELRFAGDDRHLPTRLQRAVGRAT